MRSSNIQPSFSVSQKRIRRREGKKGEGMDGGRTLSAHALAVNLVVLLLFIASHPHPLFSLFYFPLIMRWHKTHYGMGSKTGRNKGCARKEFLPPSNFRGKGKNAQVKHHCFFCTLLFLGFCLAFCFALLFCFVFVPDPLKGTHAQTQNATTDKKNYQQKQQQKYSSVVRKTLIRTDRCEHQPCWCWVCVPEQKKKECKKATKNEHKRAARKAWWTK